MGLLSGLRLDTLLKRLCKSLLKKRLGDLILGDLDLDQFDLQLTRGTLQLNDLALNVDYINRKVRPAPSLSPVIYLFFCNSRGHLSPATLPSPPVPHGRGWCCTFSIGCGGLVFSGDDAVPVRARVLGDDR